MEFARLNAQVGTRFAGIAKSSVPVLLPIDIDRFRADVAAGKPEAATSDGYFGPFHPSKFFLPGPAGYSATFFLNNGDGGLDFTFRKPVEIEITGAAFIYDLEGASHAELFPAPALEAAFPGIKRILHEAHVRYVFERFGVPYVVSIQCYDRPPARRYLSCKEADPIAIRFLRLLRTAGGSPLPVKHAAHRPQRGRRRNRRTLPITARAISSPTPAGTSCRAAPTTTSMPRCASRSPTRRPM